ncbi:hypothetical protein CUMW_096080 [Citrus unshiu]|uniref:Uncharacterized protein n=1 Tax=Citrus unshiu TaxID=55188 RepID=A0A2H5P1R8_CITUN|nr:hypothetical protein CUMW_096070 [Citrus unshiu]GAY46313.1 hypothetical protein CUMW_096080 [Citrus unshiu]
MLADMSIYLLVCPLVYLTSNVPCESLYFRSPKEQQIFGGTNIALQSLPAFEFGVCLGEKLSAVAFSAAGFELYSFSFSFHVS